MTTAKINHGKRRTFALSAILLTLLCWVPGAAAPAGAQTDRVAGFPPEEALRLGERMYVQGILPSGAPMQGMVQGDIPVEGTKFTCANCHQRSGFGSMEGTVRTPPIDGVRLFAPYSSFKGVPLHDKGKAAAEGIADVHRPAYTDETLARVMRTGEDPSGAEIFNTMPKYFLDDRDMAILVHYLRQLSTGLEPGVTDTELRFATIVAGDVSKEDREAMVGPLRMFVSQWRPSKNLERMTRRDAFVREGISRSLRRMSLTVWELKGPADTWRAQLEEMYRKEPVFAFLGGISNGDWEPIHRFCEDRKIPSIFPITNFPVISETDWYTLYLSRGFYQEGETAAKYIDARKDLKDLPLVQVFRSDAAGTALSKSFQETWTGLGNKAPENVSLAPDETLSPGFWKQFSGKHKQAIVLLWLNGRDFPASGLAAGHTARPGMFFASARLLGQNLFTLPDKERKFFYFTYPFTLPGEIRQQKAPTGAPQKADIPAVNSGIAPQINALSFVLNGPLAMMRNYVYRDYFLELIEAMPDLTVASTLYPRLSFGAGQRYASKGCYIVQLSEGPGSELIKRSDWVIH